MAHSSFDFQLESRADDEQAGGLNAGGRVDYNGVVHARSVAKEGGLSIIFFLLRKLLIFKGL